MEGNWLSLLQNANQLTKVIETNQYTEQFGLILSEQDAQLILEKHNDTLRELKRVEFGESIIPKIIREFCDSDYIDQGNYVDTMIRLQEIFCLYKNEMQDKITDDELLHLMKEQYELLCFGVLDYMEDTCLADFAQAVREGYREYMGSDGYGEHSKFDQQERWSYDLYMEILKDLFWR